MKHRSASRRAQIPAPACGGTIKGAFAATLAGVLLAVAAAPANASTLDEPSESIVDLLEETVPEILADTSTADLPVLEESGGEVEFSLPSFQIQQTSFRRPVPPIQMRNSSQGWTLRS